MTYLEVDLGMYFSFSFSCCSFFFLILPKNQSPFQWLFSLFASRWNKRRRRNQLEKRRTRGGRYHFLLTSFFFVSSLPFFFLLFYFSLFSYPSKEIITCFKISHPWSQLWHDDFEYRENLRSQEIQDRCFY